MPPSRVGVGRAEGAGLAGRRPPTDSPPSEHAFPYAESHKPTLYDVVCTLVCSNYAYALHGASTGMLSHQPTHSLRVRLSSPRASKLGFKLMTLLD